MQNLQKPRFGWLDTLKLIAAYCVYVCHAEGLGRIGLVAITMQLPCFFFASGFVFNPGTEGFFTFLKKKFTAIMIPYFAFSLLSLSLRIVLFEYSLGQIIASVREILLGIRNRVPLSAMWFLPCLFCTALLYYGLSKLIKNSYLLLLCCFILSAAVKLIREEPTYIWGVDMAVRFMIYYAIGGFARGVYNGGSLVRLWARHKATAATLLTAICGVVLYVFYINFYYGNGYFASLIGYEMGYAGRSLAQFLYNVNFIAVGVFIALPLSRIEGFCKAGRVTLAIMGGEQIVKTLVPLAIESLGLTPLQYSTPPQTLVYSAILVTVAYYAFAKPIKQYFPEILGKKIILKKD